MGDITVLMSVCGTSQWLAEAVLSIRVNSPKVQILISANGPAEWEPCMRVAQLLPTYNVVYRAETLPLSDSLNSLLADVRTRYVIRVDPDDLLPPGTLAVMRMAAQGVKAPIVLGHYRDFGLVSDRVIKCKQPTAQALYSYSVGPYNYLAETDILHAVGGWRDTAYDDWDLLISLIAAGCTPVCLDRVILNHRVRVGSRLERLLPHHEENLAELREYHHDWFHAQGVV